MLWSHRPNQEDCAGGSISENARGLESRKRRRQMKGDEGGGAETAAARGSSDDRETEEHSVEDAER